MVLLHALVHAQKLLSLQIEVCHVNHRLRDSSDADASFVKEWCLRHSLECHQVVLDPPPKGENIEAWARARRYEAFRTLLAGRPLDLVCTAHTANDAAETLLMRLIANKELTSIDEEDPRRRCIRPLLENSRQQINEYVEHYKLEYVEDPTNRDLSFVRNRVRHTLLPLIEEKFEPSIAWILSERARSLAADSRALQWSANTIATQVGEFREADGEWLLRLIEALEGVPDALQWRVVQAIFTPRFGYALGEQKARLIVKGVLERAGELQVGPCPVGAGEQSEASIMSFSSSGIAVVQRR
jgi:tRNA(Ile)-lysidine synthase